MKIRPAWLRRALGEMFALLFSLPTLVGEILEGVWHGMRAGWHDWQCRRAELNYRKRPNT